MGQDGPKVCFRELENMAHLEIKLDMFSEKWLESPLAIDVVVFIVPLDKVSIPQSFNNLEQL